MNTLTKISVFALFSLFLTACDKPANQPATSNTTEQTPATTPHTTVEEKADTAKPEMKTETGVADYKMLREWQANEERALSEAIDKAVSGLNDKQKEDPALVQETMNKALLAQIEAIKANAESLNIQDAEVKALRDKTIEVLALGAEMIVEGAKMEKNPTPEAHKAFGELQSKLNQLAEEGQTLENALKLKYESTAEPAQPATQQ